MIVDCVAGERHVKVSVGRDFHDSTPTRGVFKGTHTRELKVAVVMAKLALAANETPMWSPAWMASTMTPTLSDHNSLLYASSIGNSVAWVHSPIRG